MSFLSDQICKELSNDNIITENKSEDISNIKKRTEKIKKDLDEIKGNSHTDNNTKDVVNNLNQINRLAKLIKELDKQQLRGIIPI